VVFINICHVRSEVRGQRSRLWPDQLTYNGGGIHFDGVASKLTCSCLQTVCWLETASNIAVRIVYCDYNKKKVILQLKYSICICSCCFYYAATNSRWRRHYVFWLSSVCPSVRCPSVNTHLAWRDVSFLSGPIWMKLATDIHHVSRHC